MKQLLFSFQKKVLGMKFSLRKLSKQDGFSDRRKYASTHLDWVGEGSSRVTFKLNTRHVLKLAYNDAGLAQNKNEVEVFQNLESRNVITRIRAWDKSFRWLVVEHAECFATSEQFITASGGIDLYQIQGMQVPDNDVEEAKRLVKNIKDLVTTHDLAPGDIYYVGHWGKNRKGNVVLMDYGLSRPVHREFY